MRQKDPLRPLTNPERRALEQLARSQSAPALSVARARATDKAGALWLRANCSSARRSEADNRRSGSFWRMTALLGQCIGTAPEVYRIIAHHGKPGVK
ncbi:MAG: hypothetical protein JOZ87_00980 [Chloroflexi bacterium]|nr:hypothetical protein [Chloroflexota bacterium]